MKFQILPHLLLLALLSPTNSFFLTPPHAKPAPLHSTPASSVSAVPSTDAFAKIPDPTALSPRWTKKTKQLATLGPVSSPHSKIESLFLVGADIFRLNFSHGSNPEKLDLLNIIRQIEEKHNYPIAILGDLQGPKLR